MTSTVTQTQKTRPGTWAPIAYACTLAFSATVGSMAAVVLFVPVGEPREVAGIFWAMSIPAFIGLSALSCFVYPIFRRATTAVGTGAIYLVNLAGVAIGGFGLAYAVVSVAGGR